MDPQHDCCICGRVIGKGQKYDLNYRDDAYFVGNFLLELKLSDTAHGTKVCARCYNRNREINNIEILTRTLRIEKAKKRAAPSSETSDCPTPTKKIKDENDIRERYVMDTSSIEALGALLLASCPQCGRKWLQTRQRGRGNVLEMDIFCEGGHCSVWQSSRVPSK